MRIMAHFSHKNNGDMLSVTMETINDCKREEADVVVDGLFALAKAAVQRQVNGNGNGKPHPKDPEAPISPRQKSLIIKLAKERGDFIKGLNEMRMGEASEVIENLLAVEV